MVPMLTTTGNAGLSQNACGVESGFGLLPAGWTLKNRRSCRANPRLQLTMNLTLPLPVLSGDLRQKVDLAAQVPNASSVVATLLLGSGGQIARRHGRYHQLGEPDAMVEARIVRSTGLCARRWRPRRAGKLHRADEERQGGKSLSATSPLFRTA